MAESVIRAQVANMPLSEVLTQRDKLREQIMSKMLDIVKV